MSSQSISTDINPVKFFETSLTKDGLLKLENQFYYPINASQRNNKGEGFKVYLKSEYINEEVYELKEYFVNSLLIQLEVQSKISLELLSKRKALLEYKGIYDDNFYKIQINNLEKLKLNTQEYRYQDEILDKLNFLIREVHKFMKEDKIKVTTIKQDKIVNSYFQVFDRVRRVHLKKLYELCLDLEIFDGSTSSEDIFLNVLTTDNPNKTNDVLRFNKNNYFAIIFFNSIKPWFGKLSYSKIGKSELFMSKGNTIFNQGLLDTSNKRLNEKIENYRTEILALEKLISDLK